MKALKEIFNSEEKDSLRLIGELDAHLSGKAAMQEAFDARDHEAIEIARKVVVLKAARSPRAPLVERELRLKRTERNEIRAAFNRKTDELRRKAEVLTRPEISSFLAEIDGFQRQALKLRKVVRGQEETNLAGTRVVTIQTNFEAVNNACLQFAAAGKIVQGMSLKPLGEIRAKVREFRAVFQDLDLGVLGEETQMDLISAGELQHLGSEPTAGGQEVAWAVGNSIIGAGGKQYNEYSVKAFWGGR